MHVWGWPLQAEGVGNTDPPGTLQYQPDGHYWCEQWHDMVVHGRGRQNGSGPMDIGISEEKEKE